VCYPGFNCPRQGGMASYCMEVSCNDISWYLRLANGQRLTCYSTSTSFDGWYGCFDEWEAQCY
jgi:hypothetical protein